MAYTVLDTPIIITSAASGTTGLAISLLDAGGLWCYIGLVVALGCLYIALSIYCQPELTNINNDKEKGE